MAYNREDRPATGTRIRVLSSDYDTVTYGDVGYIEEQDNTSSPFFIMDKNPGERRCFRIDVCEPEGIVAPAPEPNPQAPEKLKTIATLLLSLTVREMGALVSVMDASLDAMPEDTDMVTGLLDVADRILAA